MRWSLGIPVVHVNYFPTGVKRPDGFAFRLHGRPVIVLCRNEKQPSWLLFILAHELGHLACGHLPENGTLLDERLQENKPDDEEREANQFALKLLTGKATMSFSIDGRWPKAQELAQLAKDYGRRNHVDPGHVVLNFAHSMDANFFPLARSALNHLYSQADAMEAVRTKLAENLDWELLPEDSSEFLMRITRQESDG